MELFSYSLGKKSGGGGDGSEYIYTTIEHNTEYGNTYSNLTKKTPPLTLANDVTDLSYCFFECPAKYIDVSLFDTSNVTSMDSMFSNCPNLEEIDVSNFVLNNTNTSAMFSNCPNLKKINMANCNISLSSSKTTYMFSNCKKVAILDISSFTSSGANNTFSNLGTECLQSDGAYADGIPYIYVKNESVQSSIIAKSPLNNWTTANVIIKE